MLVEVPDGSPDLDIRVDSEKSGDQIATHVQLYMLFTLARPVLGRCIRCTCSGGGSANNTLVVGSSHGGPLCKKYVLEIRVESEERGVSMAIHVKI